MTVDYEDAKRIAKDGTYPQRAALAADPDAPPEILVFLAADSSPAVRAALATNPALPVPAFKLLASDAEMLVRLGIAQNAMKMWSQRRHNNEQEATLARASLELLAADQVLAVREALVTALLDVAAAPPQLAERLALDTAQTVAEPVLRGFAHLDDTFLVDALAERGEGWARLAIAARSTISHALSDAIVRTHDEAATVALLGNRGASFSDETYDYVAERAPNIPALHGPLSLRHDLPKRIAMRMAEYVDEAVFNVLTTRGDFDADTAREIVNVARRRIDWLEKNTVPASIRVRDLYDGGKLTEDAVMDAIAWHDDEFLVLALAVKSRVPPPLVRAMLKSDNPKAIMAIAWRAGLGARSGVKLQKTPGGIAPHKLLHPRGGTDYPMDEAELLWQLEFYGVKI